MKLRWILPAALITVALVAGGVTLAMLGDGVSQPIAFNHRLHVEDLALECADCHRYVLTGARATIPNIEVCADCHEEAQTDSPAEAQVVAHIQEGEKIPWQKVYHVPEHVYFSHRRHAALAEIECATCHGPMEEREEPVTRPAVDLTMDRCIECHEEEGVSNDCVWCHR